MNRNDGNTPGAPVERRQQGGQTVGAMNEKDLALWRAQRRAGAHPAVESVWRIENMRAGAALVGRPAALARIEKRRIGHHHGTRAIGDAGFPAAFGHQKIGETRLAAIGQSICDKIAGGQRHGVCLAVDQQQAKVWPVKSRCEPRRAGAGAGVDQQSARRARHGGGQQNGIRARAMPGLRLMQMQPPPQQQIGPVTSGHRQMCRRSLRPQGGRAPARGVSPPP